MELTASKLDPPLTTTNASNSTFCKAKVKAMDKVNCAVYRFTIGLNLRAQFSINANEWTTTVRIQWPDNECGQVGCRDL